MNVCQLSVLVSGRLKHFSCEGFASDELLLFFCSRLIIFTSWIFRCMGVFGAFGPSGAWVFSGLINFCCWSRVPVRRFGSASFISIVISDFMDFYIKYIKFKLYNLQQIFNLLLLYIFNGKSYNM